MTPVKFFENLKVGVQSPPVPTVVVPMLCILISISYLAIRRILLIN